jgi:hypothetical protein
MCEMNQIILILKNLERTRSFYTIFLANQITVSNYSVNEKIENFHVFAKITNKEVQNQIFHAIIRKSGPPLSNRCIFQLYGPTRLLRIEVQS